MRVERLRRVLIECRHEHDRRDIRGVLFGGDLHPIKTGQAYVEKQRVRAKRLHLIEHFQPVACRTHRLDLFDPIFSNRYGPTCGHIAPHGARGATGSGQRRCGHRWYLR